MPSAIKEGALEIVRLVGALCLGSAEHARQPKREFKTRADRKDRGAAQTRLIRRQQNCGFAVLVIFLLLSIGGAFVTAGKASREAINLKKSKVGRRATASKR